MSKKGLLQKKVNISDKLLSKLPLTYWGILRSMVGNDFKTILDVGCGNGDPMAIINSEGKFDATGVDIYEPYLRKCKSRKIYKKLIKTDVRDLPFQNGEFDVVVSFHVLEHLTKKEGKLMLKKMESIAKKRVVIALPHGHLPQEEFDGNTHQEHISEWYPKELKKMGYKVVGQGLLAIYGNVNVVEKFGFFSNVIFALSLLSQPLLLFKPEMARYLICRKNLNEK